MKEINELIVMIAKKKAEAARESAEKAVINGIVFEEGIQPGEVKLESGTEELSALLGCTLREGYADLRGDYAYRVRWFSFEGVRFFEEKFSRVEEIPEGTMPFANREELYASV
ncbi:MAG: hypothetical protein K2N29_06590 [Ruminiclostridium sp.]|nr:hypothetical protein [Ruminiclostridium sp.]